MILIKWLRVATALLCLATLQAQPALAGKYGSFRSAQTRTPSISAPSPAPRVTASPSPSTSSNGGYGSFRTDRTPSITAPPRPALVGSDRAISRENSGSALRDMRRQDAIARETATRPPASTAAPSNEGGLFSRPTWTRPTVTERTPSVTPAPQWQRQADWTIPSYAQPRQSYGDWNPFLMWYLIGSLSRPGSSEFFHNHQNDPGYRQWRQEADNQARTNAELKAKLDDLDRKLAEKKDEPVNADYVPPDIDPKIAHATQPVAAGGGHWLLTLFVILLLGALAALAWITWNERRKRRAHDRTGLEPMSNASLITDIVKTKIQGTEHAAPERFKVGQVITIERTPFIMASATKIVRPETRDGTTSITRIGKLSGAGSLTRLYLDDINFLQVSEAADGTIADCRYFSRIDEVYPATADDWRLWLDPQSGWTDLEQGILSDPKFRTEDDALYDRVWSPGDGRVPPREMRERVSNLAGTREIAITAQLYARAMPDAADKREYLLAEVREERSDASVIIYAGIDLPASSLGL